MANKAELEHMGAIKMTKMAIIFTDTPDGGFDFDMVSLDGKPDMNSKAFMESVVCASLYRRHVESKGYKTSEESGILGKKH